MTPLFAYGKHPGMNSGKQADQSLEAAIADRIRQKRLFLEWTLEQLAKVTGLSKSYLSQIENNEKTPPISTLTKIAYALGMNTIELITGQHAVRDPQKFSLVRRGERQNISHTDAAKGSVYSSFGFSRSDRLMDSYIVTVSHEFPDRPMIHSGQEMTYTIEGEHEFYYDGHTYTLKAGDATYFDSDRPHMSRSLSAKPAKVLVVFCNPARAK